MKIVETVLYNLVTLAVLTLISVSSVAVNDETTELEDKFKIVTADSAVQENANLRNKAASSAVTSPSRAKIIVRYKDKNKLSLVNQAARPDLKSKIVKQYKNIGDIQLVQATDGRSVEELLAAYRSDPNVLYAEVDQPLSIDLVPNDPQFNGLWGLNNTGQTGGTADADINTPEAWDFTTGDSGIVIASIDTGIDYNHPDLVDNLWVNPGEIPGNGLDDDGNGYVDDVYGINTIDGSGNPFDDNGHGTHTSGTMAATGNNADGVTGVAWNTKIVSCKFLDVNGNGFTSDAIECLDYLLDLKTRVVNPVNIVLSNNSWGGGGFSQVLHDAIAAHQAADILFVASAGNSNSNNDTQPSYPGSYDLPGIISVAATDHNDLKAFFSSYGRSSVDVGAPGVNILSTFPVGGCTLCTSANQYNPAGYGVISGTSMAAPHVAGLAALLKAQDTSRNIAQIKNLIISSGQAIPALTDITVSGKRIRAADIGGVGALTCFNQTVSRRTVPASNALTVIAGDIIPLQYVNLNCDQVIQDSIEVIIQPGGEKIALHDDGLSDDAVANDGIYSGAYTASEEGSISFPNGDVVTIEFANNYRPAQLVGYNYREISPNVGRTAASFDEFFITGPLPFPIHFRGDIAGFTKIIIGSNAYIGFHDGKFLDNTALPVVDSFRQPETFVMPFWDDFDTSLNYSESPQHGIYQEVQGTAPNREYVVEFRNFAHKRGVFPDVATFQVIFFENSSDVLFNYKDVFVGDPSADAGAEATVGIQSHPSLFQQFSYNQASLADGMSLLWELGIPPEADAGIDFTTVTNVETNVDGSGSTDSDSAIVDYKWIQISGQAVTLINSNAAIAHFTAPATPGVLEFLLTVKDEDGNVGTDRVVVDVQTVIDPSLTAHYTFDEGLGDIANDTGGSGQHGLLVNGPLWVSGKIGSYALDFDGSDQYVDLGGLDVSGSEITITAWFNSDNLYNCGFDLDCRILSKAVGTATQDHYFMVSTFNGDGAKLRFRLKTDGITDQLIGYDGPELQDNTWYHVAAVYDGTQMILYMNGIEVGSQPKTGVIDNNPSVNTLIGANAPGIRSWDGKVDDVRIYNRALTQQEVESMVAGIPSPPDTIAPSRSNGFPTGILPAGTTATIVSLNTNEPANCRFDTLPGTPFDSMPLPFNNVDDIYHETNFVGLIEGQSYTLYVKCQDLSFNANADDYEISFSIEAPDSTPPSVPSNVQTNILSATSVEVSWDAATDPETGIKNYIIYRDSINIGTPTSTTFTDIDLLPGTSYVYEISAVNNEDIESQKSSPVPVTTPSSNGDLIAHYSFDEGSGGYAYDSSGNGLDAITVNNPTWVEGWLGGALEFDGVDQWVGRAGINVSTAEITFSAWFNSADFDNCGFYQDCRILSQATGTAEQDHYFMVSTFNVFSGTVVRFRLKTDGVTDTLIANEGYLSENIWYHVAAVYDGTEMQLYLNGVLVGSMPKTGSVDSTDHQPFNIGANPIGFDNTRFWNGKIDDVRIYNRALSQSEIEALASQ